MQNNKQTSVCLCLMQQYAATKDLMIVMNLIGGTNYYDAHGKLIGRSRDNLVGGSSDTEGFANQTSTRPAERNTYEEHEYSNQSTHGTKWIYIILTVILIALGASEGIAVALAGQIDANLLSETEYPDVQKLTEEDYFYENNGYLYSGVYVLQLISICGKDVFKDIYAGNDSI